MSRGGPRHGRPGIAYPNRSDLTSMPKVAPGQQYGQAGQQLAAQQQMPIAPQPTPGAGAPPVPEPGVAPGQFGALDRPTERPDEPLTAGAPVGPGPNSIVGLPTAPDSSAADLERLRRQLPLLQIMASNPNASAQTRSLYRQVLMSNVGQA